MKIKTVTITGADDNTNHVELLKLEREFPFVEWGILFSETKMGQDRYPSRQWLHEFLSYYPKNLSAHICGKYMRELLAGDPDLFGKEKIIWESFKRVQLNFNVKHSKINLLEFFNSLKVWSVEHGFENYILQVNNSNDDFINNVILPYSYNNELLVFLFDGSGGNGVLREWREPIVGQYCGYAGGLSDENIEEQLKLIESKVGNREIWIDVETGVRTDNKLDLDKVKRFLTIAQRYV